MSYKPTNKLDDYLKGNLDKKSKENFQKTLAEDKFLSDATDGFEEFPGTEKNIEEVKRKIINKNSVKATASSKLMLIGTIFLFVVAVSLSVYRMFSKNEKIKTDSDNQKTEKFSPFLISDEEIIEAVPMDSHKQIRYINTIKNQSVSLQEKKTEPEILEKIEAKKISEITNDPLFVSEKELNKKRISVSNHPLLYIYNLKVVDYSKVYKNNLKTNNLSGLDSKYENNISQKSDAESDKTYVTYNYFLTASLDKYKNNDFKNSLRDFSVILKHFPEDLNAYFYGGLCLYNLQKFDRAIQFFNQAIENPVNSFYQEARWYKALSMIQKNENEDAKNLLKEIIDEEGFYASKAEEKVKALR
ncbi:MAG: hypothetical protein A2275_12310 [Bacteroidetes bacterium RIFOXYA12_FULL_35_11]|nr:MAG: hypothetical protein A2X01_02365 [Bacteroidetes bacterium GWF2_35_48]OFY77864.1 MAG: hypothetical protein A2275_12310 [Bacteroidetes bacterium RIFOXYA12_FULL_35_11]OFY93905.1 MAG: hypothetical protein A2309_02620 [Bacteroidetes bacterium RIFOXYB2_FULL_35_7]HBX50334.1 hypothetical protein [Bacteroidales bacterium]